MIKVLAVGNSYSHDATYYLHQIAAADGVDIKAVNLFIAACPLKRHWDNAQSEAKDYLYEENGASDDKHVSIQEALDSDKWDYIITQQASYDSGIEETYYPYIENLADYFRKKAPNAELLLHQTWAYEIDSTHGGFAKYNRDQHEMYVKLSEAYKNAAQKIGARLIPCGDAIQLLRKREPFIYEKGGISICRDGYHMNLIYGRYLLAAVWYKFFTGNPILNNTYIPATKLAPDAVCDENALNVIKQTVDDTLLWRLQNFFKTKKNESGAIPNSFLYDLILSDIWCSLQQQTYRF